MSTQLLHPPGTIIDFAPGLKLIHRGKVRDTHDLPGHPDKLLVVVTDRISALDFILPVLVPNKGYVLNAMSIFWTRALCQFQYDLVAFGSAIDLYLPANLQGNADLQRRAVVIWKLEMLPIEAIVRGYLTGSGKTDYIRDGKVCGHLLPEGLKDGSPLEKPLFTPSTKAAAGSHDVNISRDEVVKKFGRFVEDTALGFYSAAQKIALERGIIIADTKIEVGRRFPDGRLIIGDERLTPDSSRFWRIQDWEDAVRANESLSVKDSKAPKSLDKEPVRDFLRAHGITGKSSMDDIIRLDFTRVAETTSIRYVQAALRIRGSPLSTFHRDVMGIAA